MKRCTVGKISGRAPKSSQTPATKHFAEWFHLPHSSREHAMLRDEGWLIGAPVTVRYDLGRLLDRNLFRESDAVVHRLLVKYLRTITSKEGAALCSEVSDWQMVRPILHYRFETEIAGSVQRKPREVSALEAFLKNPSIAPAELAREVGTSEKQLCRMTELNYARSAPARNRARHNHALGRKPTPSRAAKRRTRQT